MYRDETRRDETRRDETRRDETRRDETRRDETRRDETMRFDVRNSGRGVRCQHAFSLYTPPLPHIHHSGLLGSRLSFKCDIFFFFCQRTFIRNVRLFHLSSRDPTLLSCRLPPECTIRLQRFLLAPTCRFPTLSPFSFVWALLGASLVLQRALVVFTSKVPSPTGTTKFWRSLINPAPHTIFFSSLPDLCHTLWVTEVMTG